MVSSGGKEISGIKSNLFMNFGREFERGFFPCEATNLRKATTSSEGGGGGGQPPPPNEGPCEGLPPSLEPKPNGGFCGGNPPPAEPPLP